MSKFLPAIRDGTPLEINRSYYLQKVVLVLLLVTLLSMIKVEGWNATSLVPLTLITVIIIKLLGIATAYSDLVKRPPPSFRPPPLSSSSLHG